MKKAIAFLLFACLLFPRHSVAKHLLGGYITYRVLPGTTGIEFEMTLFRDCTDPTGAGFDDPAYLAVYRGNQEPYELYETVYLSVSEVYKVVPGQAPPGCQFNPDAACLEIGIYKGTLPYLSGQSYHLVYQRCCLSAVIGNVVTPGDYGLTISAEITPQALLKKNRSPGFEMLEFFGFNGYPFDFKVAVVESEGDSLSMGFCHLTAGGGNTISGPGVFGCDGIMPNPPCPPPFDTVPFTDPPYSAAYPIPSNPSVSLDPQSGWVSGTPSLLGQFLYAVCVKEYRGGQFLGETRSIFQMWVGACLTGTSDPEGARFRIFPNPAAGTVQADLPDDWERFEIFDPAGRLVFSEKTGGQQTLEWDVSGWPAGLYFSKMTVQGRVFFKKLLKSRG